MPFLAHPVYKLHYSAYIREIDLSRSGHTDLNNM